MNVYKEVYEAARRLRMTAPVDDDFPELMDQLDLAIGRAEREERDGTAALSFDTLREANVKRLPTFKNAHGLPAHSEPDGSDWSDAQWLEAVVGEVGEYANIHKKYVRGDITRLDFLDRAERELADIVTYLDILAFRLGIDLGIATRMKFNEVSERVGSPVYIVGDAVVTAPQQEPNQ